MKRTQRALMVGAFALTAVFSPCIAAARQGGIVFFYYDGNGRLSSMVKPTGEVAIYQYDPAGNIQAISRVPAPSSISGISPASGPGVFVRDGSASFDLDTLDLFAGSYTIRINPEGASTGRLTVSVTSPLQDKARVIMRRRASGFTRNEKTEI